MLVVEEADTRTLDALARVCLPAWMRTVLVPDGPIRTKPRALNYALDFFAGGGSSVSGTRRTRWPLLGQLHAIAPLAETGPGVACLQGISTTITLAATG